MSENKYVEELLNTKKFPHGSILDPEYRQFERWFFGDFYPNAPKNVKAKLRAILRAYEKEHKTT